jgi:sugar lactone lactonase YvrE
MGLSIENVSEFISGLDHPECVAVHPDGSIWAGGEAGQIYRISADGSTLEEINNTGGFTQGIAFSPDMSWLAVCDSKNKCVWKLRLKDNQLEKFATGAGEHTFNIPNYASFDSQGRLYVSESGAFREVSGKILRFAPDGTGEIWHPGPFNFANGLALSVDEKYLYIACTWLPGVERVEINEDGSAGKREVFATLPQTCPDGLAFDTDENLYVSCYIPNCIYKMTKNQESSVLIDDWEAHTLSNPTNIAFGGKGFGELFVANLGRWHISKIEMPASVKGLRLPCHK